MFHAFFHADDRAKFQVHDRCSVHVMIGGLSSSLKIAIFEECQGCFFAKHR